ncbi:MAG: hypothetical protein EHM40_06935 [Chloroflexi bacterium]|nr:MAG: hypothetical protein EHM40_06935 [Chloroflexota bacterium]
MKTRIVYYVLGVFVALLVLASVAGLSVYAYRSNNNLLATQEQLHTLQEAHDKLKTDHAALNNEFDQTRSDLEAANGDLEAANGRITSLEGELKVAKEQNQQLEQTMQMAKLNMNVLNGLFDDSISLQDMEARIAAAGNSEMSEKWAAISDQDALGNFIVYLVHSVWESLN